jgi:Uma2 family endonuclease
MSATELITPPPQRDSLPGLTPEEFMRLYSDEDYVELIRGEVVQLTPPGLRHGLIGEEVRDVLKPYVKIGNLGIVLSMEIGYVLEREPYTVRAPDVSFISQARLEQVEDEEKHFPGAPDLAVEILSPTDSLRATESKARMYLRAGGSVVWILDPKDKTLRIYRPDADPIVLGPDDEADAEPALPGFRCNVGNLFPKPANKKPL